MKRSKQTTLNPLVRLLAAGAVLVWVVASGSCALESLVGHIQEGDAGHIAERAASAHPDSSPPQDSDKHEGHEGSCCSSLQATEFTFHSVSSVKPDFGQIGALVFVWATPLFTLADYQEPLSRLPPDREWVFTPEVCLGPAFRSHAPPLAG